MKRNGLWFAVGVGVLAALLINSTDLLDTLNLPGIAKTAVFGGIIAVGIILAGGLVNFTQNLAQGIGRFIERLVSGSFKLIAVAAIVGFLYWLLVMNGQ
jgi:hypothetical protein